MSDQFDYTKSEVKAEYISAKDLEDKYGFPRATMRRWYGKGIMPRPLKIDGKHYWKRAWIEGWLDSNINKQDAGKLERTAF